MISLVVDRPSNNSNTIINSTSPRRNSSTFNNELNTSRKVSINYKPNGNSYFIDSIGELNDKEVSRRKRNEDVDEEQPQPSPSPLPPASCVEINRSGSDCASAVSESVTSSEKNSHVVKIKISPTIVNGTLKVDVNENNLSKTVIDDNRKVTIVNLLSKEEAILNKQQQTTPSLKININSDMVQQKTSNSNVGSSNPNQLESPNYLYYMMTSGQFSPSDTLDSGTCSDLDTSGNSGCSSGTTPPLKTPDLHMKSTKLLMNSGLSYRHKNSSSTDPDSDGSESSLSCDSLNSAEYLLLNEPPITLQGSRITKLSFLPDSLLRDIRDRKNSSDTDISSNSEKFTTFAEIDKLSEKIDNLSEKIESNVLTFKKNVKNSLVDIKPMVDNLQVTPPTTPKFENDKFYNFHINEHKNGLVDRTEKIDETFAGYKDVHNTSAMSTIRSNKGTVRGVKNRVRNGIATFLQMQSNMKVSLLFMYFSLT